MGLQSTYLLGIRGTLIRGVMIDDDRNIVGMGVNTVSTMTADVLRYREHGNIGGGE